METTKRWYQSKTIWAGVAAVVLAAYNAGAQVFSWPELPEFLYALLGALGVYGRAAANTEISAGK